MDLDESGNVIVDGNRNLKRRTTILWQTNKDNEIDVIVDNDDKYD